MGSASESQFGIEFKTDFGPMRGSLSRFGKTDRGLIMLVLLLIFMPLVAEAQEWQAYQLTNYEHGQFNECTSVRDAAGNLHVYFNFETLPPLEDHAVYYMRVSPYGEILTDTTRLNLYPYSYEIGPQCVGNGTDRSWGMWAESPDSTVQNQALYLAGRDQTGAEVLPSTWVHLSHYGPGEAGYRNSDSTIHFFNSSYCRLSVSGNPLIWEVTVPEDRPPAHINFAVAPNGTPWGMLRYSLGPTADLALVRFNEDTTCTVYYPFGYQQERRWGLYDFTIDWQGHFHCLVEVDTCALAYALLDTSMALLEWHPLLRDYGTRSAIGVDSFGNSLMVWKLAEERLLWAYRTIDGAWSTDGETLVDSIAGANYFSMISYGESRWAITCPANVPLQQDPRNIYLFTFGFPPNSVGPQPRTSRSQLVQIFPNPFRSVLYVQGSLPPGSEVVIYDILGRRVFGKRLMDSQGCLYFGDAQLSSLPSGYYVLSLAVRDKVHSYPIFHLK
jgi:hypothetical protein